MFDPSASLLVVVLLLNFTVLGVSRLRAVIHASAAQGIAIGALTPLVQHDFGVLTVLIAAGAIGVKGFLIPWLLTRAMRDLQITREVEPFIRFIPSMLLGAVATGLALIFSGSLPLAPQHVGSLLVPTSLATILTGFIVLTTRRKAITQVVGYLVLENGIFVMGLTLLDAMPFLIEVGVLLDLFVAIFVMGIIINQINREFESIDTGRLSLLKEE